jgi:hypothetical protein
MIAPATEPRQTSGCLFASAQPNPLELPSNNDITLTNRDKPQDSFCYHNEFLGIIPRKTAGPTAQILTIGVTYTAINLRMYRDKPRDRPAETPLRSDREKSQDRRHVYCARCCPRGTYNEQGLGSQTAKNLRIRHLAPIPKELRRIRRKKENEEELLTSGSLTLAISRITLRLRSAAPTLRHKAANAAHRPALRADQFNKDIERQKKEGFTRCRASS